MFYHSRRHQDPRRTGSKMTVPKLDARAIEAHGISHTYRGGHVALTDVDLSLGTGLFGLLGPNGAGKSTLLRIIGTLLKPTRGTMSVCGYDVTREPLKVRSLIGYLPQEFGAWRLHRTEEVVDTLARMSGLWRRRERRRRVSEVLATVGLESGRRPQGQETLWGHGAPTRGCPGPGCTSRRC